MRNIYGVLLAASIVLGCDKEKYQAAVPAYMRLDAMQLTTNFAQEGTASSKITSAWVYMDGALVGVYELPAEFPVIGSGNHSFEVFAGINENGTAATRVPYSFYNAYAETINLVPGEVHYFNAGADSIPKVTYRSNATIVKIEDFEGVGINLIETSKSDTLLYSVQDSAYSFVYPGEDGINSGVAYLPNRNAIWEVSEQSGRNLPAGLPIYLEMNYKNTLPMVVGLYITTPASIIQAQTAILNPSEDWNKIYINFYSDVTGYSTAYEFKVFVGSLTTGSGGIDSIYIDNLKLVY